MRETIAPREIPHYDRQRSVTISADLATRTPGRGPRDRHARSRDQVLPRRRPGPLRRRGGEVPRVEQRAALRLRARDRDRLPGAGGAVRELRAPGDDPGGGGALLHRRAAWRCSRTRAPRSNLFSKIGLVMLVGLVTKNSILIVEFANQLRERGLRLVEAVKQASHVALPPDPDDRARDHGRHPADRARPRRGRRLARAARHRRARRHVLLDAAHLLRRAGDLHRDRARARADRAARARAPPRADPPAAIAGS